MTALEHLENNKVVGMTELLTDIMIEFAKYHVKLALKEANMKSRLRIIPNTKNIYFREEILVSNIEDSTQNMWIRIEDTSIINSYPLENIK